MGLKYTIKNILNNFKNFKLFQKKEKMDKNQLNAFKVKLKDFKKISGDDFQTGRDKAKELINDIETFLKHPVLVNNTKYKNEFEKIKDGLELYISNTTAMEGFEKKWKK